MLGNSKDPVNPTPNSPHPLSPGELGEMLGNTVSKRGHAWGTEYTVDNPDTDYSAGEAYLIDGGNDNLHVRGLHVSPEDRGKGVATAILTKILEDSKGRTVNIEAEASEDSPMTTEQIADFYKRMGLKVKEAKKKDSPSKAYKVSGDKVQGVGLRKTFHDILQHHKVQGLGVNDPETGDVQLHIQGDHNTRKRVLKALKKAMRERTGNRIQIAKAKEFSKWHDVEMTDKDIEDLQDIHHEVFLRSSKYDPTNPLHGVKPTLSEAKKIFMERFRLKDTDGRLTGSVPTMAKKQLTGETMPYKWMNFIKAQEAKKILRRPE